MKIDFSQLPADSLWPQVAEAWKGIADIHISLIYILGLLVALVSVNLVLLALRRLHHSSKEGHDVKRRKRVRQLGAEAVVDAVEDLVYKNKISRGDADYLYRLYSASGLPGLLPRRLRIGLPLPDATNNAGLTPVRKAQEVPTKKQRKATSAKSSERETPATDQSLAAILARHSSKTNGAHRS